MKTLQGWTINDYGVTEQIYQDGRTLVYRAYCLSDQTPVVLKLLRSEYPSFSELMQFRNQWTIAEGLNLPNVIQIYGLESYQNRDVLVMEDFDGISLDQAMLAWKTENPEKIGAGLLRFFEIIRQVVTGLEGLYQHQIIHKDIKPANILINQETQEVKLIDFSIASRLHREVATLAMANTFEGTLAYLSPEQTGRMNRGIDYRTDFYSLGVICFELLAGCLPFTADEPMEMLHCHLAVQPPLLHSINPEVPPIVSAIVAKLMAKNVEDRYQSMFGIQHDLAVCRKQWENTGSIEPFQLGQQDQCDRFIISERLYGRDQEIATLLASFNRVAEVEEDARHTELCLVSGHSGLGKTAIIHEIYHVIVARQGYFITGKFDQLQRNIPFSALLQALRDLIRQILSQSDTQIQHWKLQVLQALGENIGVMIEVIPELAKVVGAQPAAIELSGSAAQNRFHLVFQKFIQIFATPEHPLVIFLDDLQWADLATLQLVQTLMGTASSHLLLIGAYRQNEINATHPLHQFLAENQKAEMAITTINLEPLTSQDLNHFVADSLNLKIEETEALSQFMHGITQGNPFFCNQLLQSWYEDECITFDWATRSWQFDLTAIQSLGQTEDVVDFIRTKLQKLPQATQTALQLAACIGNEFDLMTLVKVSKKAPTEITADLYPALQEGLIARQISSQTNSSTCKDKQSSYTGINVYQFLHDRIQQAAYQLIPDDLKVLTQFQIGRLLLENTPESDREEQIFAIVNPLNYGVALIMEPEQRDELAQLNLIAGRKAIAATAYSLALNYLMQGIRLLRETCWQSQYQLTLELYEPAIESAALSGNLEVMESLSEKLLQNVDNLLDRTRTYEIKIQAYSSQNRLLEAIAVAQEALQALGFNLATSPSQSDVQAAFQETAMLLANHDIASLGDLPTMTNTQQIAVMRIVMSILPSAFLAIPPLYPILVLSQVNASIQYGNTEFSALFYACYGLLLNAILRETDLANQFAQLANQLTVKLDSKVLNARTYFIIANFLTHNKFHLQETLPLLLDSYQMALQTGNNEYVGYCTQHICNNAYLIGRELSPLAQEIHSYNLVLADLNQITSLNYCKIFYQTVLQWINVNEQPTQLLGEACNEEELLPILLEANDITGLHFFYFHKLVLSYCFEDFIQAQENAHYLRQYLAGGTGFITTPVYYFYDSLTALALYSPDNAIEVLQQVTENQAQLKHWADHAPMNHLHKFYLVEAERYRVLGQRSEAIESYDIAIKTAQENQYLNETALAYELAGRFYADWEKPTIAQSYFINAYYCYGRWGAIAKVQALENRYPHLLMPSLKPDYNTESLHLKNNTYQSSHYYSKVGTDNNHNANSQLDLDTVIKALQALSSEIQLEKLLMALMQAMITHAGATKCILLLSDEGSWLMSLKSMSSEPILLQKISLEGTRILPQSLINYVNRTTETVVLDDATMNSAFANDPYVIEQQPKSILCTSILHQGESIGILYLENDLVAKVFTHDRLEILHLLTSQAAISLQNAQLYTTLEQKVRQRTQELDDKNQYLARMLEDLKRTQSQLIQTEKMSSLGQMVAGVAHEINNPVNFIYGNLKYVNEYVDDLVDLLQTYQSCYPEPLPKVQDRLDEIDLDFLSQDLSKIMSSMKVGADRIRQIVLSLRNFSRLDESETKLVDIHEGIDSTLLILQHRLTPKGKPAIKVIKHYGQLPKITCFASQLNQVFMNILSNGIEAIAEKQESASFSPKITIHTECMDNSTISIRIADNGSGMPETLQQKIFDPFFTTKPVGGGTGLGLSISYQIIVDRHQGQLNCVSTVGEGSEFQIIIPINNLPS